MIYKGSDLKLRDFVNLKTMKLEEIRESVISIAKDHFRDSGKPIDAGTLSADIPLWNSLNHVMLITRIEKELGIKFDLMQMIDMKSIEDIAVAAGKLIN